ncbi:MAG TPA: hypothetical protein VIZ28_08640 [Chitinophagaceae bacterium]
MQIQQVINAVLAQKDPTLHSIVNDLIHEAAPLAVHNRNYIVNNIPADLQMEANGTIISSVLDHLFHTTLRHAQNSVILISAKVYGHTILVQLKSKGTISPALPEDIGHVCQKARKTGGLVELTLHEKEQASIAYCFLNVGAEA